MELKNEEPFSFKLLSVIYSLFGNLNEYLIFNVSVENLFVQDDESLQKEIDEKLKRIPEKDHGEFIDTYALNLHQNQVLFPSMHRESMFITLYSFFEHSLNVVCEGIGRELKNPIQLKDLRGKGIERSFLFLKLVAAFNFDQIPEVVSFIKDSNKLRNIVVHNGGILPEEASHKTNTFVRSQESLLGDPGSAVMFKKEFIPLFVQKMGLFFKEIESEMQRYMKVNRSKAQASNSP